MSSRLRYPIAILSLAVSTPVLAQQPAATRVDPRWTAWLGCWQQLEETVKNENLVEAGRHGAVPTKGVVVCVTPADGAAAVTFKTIIEKQAALEDLGARSPGPQPSGEGRVVDGLGYTRVRSRDPQPRAGIGGHADGSGSSSSGGGSSGGVTSQGYSGGGGGDSGRTAVPRP